MRFTYRINRLDSDAECRIVHLCLCLIKYPSGEFRSMSLTHLPLYELQAKLRIIAMYPEDRIKILVIITSLVLL